MRRYLFILTIVLVSCSDASRSKRVISILEDKTEDDFLVVVNPEAILNITGLKEDKWQGIILRYQTITNVSYNHVKVVSLPVASEVWGNEFKREEQITRFKQHAGEMLSDSTRTGHHHSAIFKPLIKEIIHLQRDTISNTRLYLISDLQENTPDFFSVYNPYDLKKLKTKPEKVQELFLAQTTGVNRSMNHIEVVVVYEPTTVLEDQHFAMMVTLYQAVFKTLNIPISFQSNI